MSRGRRADVIEIERDIYRVDAAIAELANCEYPELVVAALVELVAVRSLLLEASRRERDEQRRVNGG
jgi:hypothetical protein